MKKSIFLLLLLILLLCQGKVFSQVPAYIWAKPMSGVANESGQSIVTDLAGNSFVTGIFESIVDFDPSAATATLASVGGNDIFLASYNNSGNYLWAISMGGTGNDYGWSVARDGNGNIYITGWFEGIVDFDPSSSVATLTATGVDIYLAKYDASGNFIWAKAMTGTQSDSGVSLVVDGSGNSFLTGIFQGTCDFDPSASVANLTSAGFNDAYIAKYDVSGNYVWAKALSGTASEGGAAITLDISGNIYVTGFYHGTVDFNPSSAVFNLTHTGFGDIFLAKYDDAGNFVWARSMGGPSSTDRVNGVAVDINGNSYITGDFQSTGDWDPSSSTANLTSVGANDIFLAKYNSAGNYVWAIRMGGNSFDEAYGITLDGNGNPYITGDFSTVADFDPSASTSNLTSTGDRDIFIAKYDPSGNYGWAKSIGGIGADYGLCTKWDGNGNLYLTGYFQNTADFDPSASTANLTSAGLADVFVGKYNVCTPPALPSAISGPTLICSSAGLTAYSVSPASGATSYVWTLPGGWSGSGTSNTINATPGTSGIFTVVSSNTCATSLQQTLSITVNPSPTITVNSGSICSGNSFTIVPSGANTYTFQGGSASVSPTSTTTYTILGTSTNGCVSQSFVTSTVTVNPLPIINATTNNSLICGPPYQQTATLTANGASTYTWSTSSSNSIIAVSPSVTTSYTVNGTNANGCSNSFVITQSVSICAGISEIVATNNDIKIYPNPNNGEFIISLNTILENTYIEIYNSLSQLIIQKPITELSTKINLTEQTNGIYFVRLNGNGINYSTKIIKE